MLTRTTDYVLRIKFGDVEATVDPHAFHEFTITQDINSFLPSFKLKTVDRQGLFTHIIPFDRRVSKMFVQFGRYEDIHNVDEHNSFTFIAYKKNPDSDGIIQIEGLLDVDGLFYPKRTIGRQGTVRSIVEDIATNELRVKNLDVSPSLNVSFTIAQGNWNNAQILAYLRDWTTGVNEDACYFVFVRMKRGKKEFVFRSLNDFIQLEPVNTFAFFREKVEDIYPIHDFRMLDTFTSFNIGGYTRQPYAYYDYYTGEFIQEELSADDYYSLTEKFLIDTNRASEDVGQISDIGRSIEYDRTRIGHVKSRYHKSLTSLSKMWITTGGMQNICPGDIIVVAFPGPSLQGKVMDFQYSGFWLVERIVHSFGSSYISKILLTRNGVDSTIESTLLSATIKKTRSRDLPEKRSFTTPATSRITKKVVRIGEDSETIDVS